MIVSICIFTVQDTNAYAYSSEYETLYEEMLTLINRYREDEGLQPLQLSEKMCQAAEIRAREISQNFGHIRPDGTASSTIFNEFNISKDYSGENIAYHYKKSVIAVMGSWLDSKAHCANMFNVDYEFFGAGLYEKDGYYYWAQLFCSNPQELSLSEFDNNNNNNNNNDIMLGDANDDGIIDASDASFVLSLYTQSSSGVVIEFTEKQSIACDVNQDGVIDASDASSILSYYAMSSTGQNPEF
ncbi:MAG: hypothetical protein K2G63_00540 [Oscillospiraceae bacterium]|nr:hypothetical protein [Oscillospiraceae bacterium]